MTERPLLLEARSLEHRYPGRERAIICPDVAVRAGERVALVGASGCGKTTLLHLLAGILPVQQGTLRTACAGVGREARLRAMGLVFQELELLAHLNAEANILLPYTAGGLREDRHATRARARSLMARLGIEALARVKPAQLSQGERQRVAACRALLTPAPVLLADEPTGNLDPTTSRRVLDVLFEIAEERPAALLVVTHDATQLEAFDRVISFDEARNA